MDKKVIFLMSVINRSLQHRYSQIRTQGYHFLKYRNSSRSTQEKQFSFPKVMAPYIQGNSQELRTDKLLPRAVVVVLLGQTGAIPWPP